MPAVAALLPRSGRVPASPPPQEADYEGERSDGELYHSRLGIRGGGDSSEPENQSKDQKNWH